METLSGGVNIVFRSVIKLMSKSIGDCIKMLFFYRSYYISTLFHDYKELLRKPDKLIDEIDYKIKWRPYSYGRKLITPMIWLKTSNDKCYKKIVFSVEAYNDKIRYQDTVTLYNINKKPTQSAIASVPFRDLKFDHNKVFPPYRHIKIKVVELCDDAGDKVELWPEVEKYWGSPNDNLAAAMGKEKGFIEVWGEVFNLEFIEYQIKIMRMEYRGGLFKRSLPRWLVDLLTVNITVKTIFWLRNLIFAKQLEKAFEKSCKELEITMQDEDESSSTIAG